MELPVIDMSKLGMEDQYLSSLIIDALQNVGFMRVDNVKGMDFDLLHKCCTWFFNLPEKTKQIITKNHWNPDNDNIYRGFSPLVDGNPPFIKECFDFGQDMNGHQSQFSYLLEKSVWPEEEDGFPFKETMMKFFRIMHSTSLELIRLIEQGLGIAEDTIGKEFSNTTCSSYRLLHYPARINGSSRHTMKEKCIVLDDHTDTNFLTLLTTFHYGGLEILTKENKWEEVKPCPKSLVINIGELCTVMTGNRCKPTRHRVVDTGKERFSVPFFLEPRIDSLVGNLVEKSKAHTSGMVPYGEWVTANRKQKQFYEYQGLP